MILRNCRLLPALSPFEEVVQADVKIEDGKIAQ